MNEFDKRLNETLAGYAETEYSADIPHEYTTENKRKAEEITRKTTKTTSIARRYPMKKRFAAALVCALVLVSSVVVYAASPAVREYINMLFLKEESAGRLTEVPEGYTGVYTAEDLDNVRNDLNGKYILMNDIVLTPDYYMEGNLFDGGFVPIGDSGNPFTGIFNGNGYVISGLVVDGAYDYAGLFGCVKQSHGYIQETSDIPDNTNYSIRNGIIKNLGLEDSKINITSIDSPTENIEYRANHARINIGGLAGYADYIVGCYTNNCTVTVHLTGKISEVTVGGIVGRAYYADSCYSTADIYFSSMQDLEKVYISGIAGYSFSCVTSYFNGTLTSNEYKNYGVTHCLEYDVPIVVPEFLMEELIKRLNEQENGLYYANLISAYYTSIKNSDIDLELQNYLTSESHNNSNLYLLDSALTSREYTTLADLLALAFPDNTFRDFCIENHIKSGYYACYDLRDTPDCTFDGFDFNSIWYDRESPKLRLFRENKKSDAMIAYENGWIKIND